MWVMVMLKSRTVSSNRRYCRSHRSLSLFSLSHLMHADSTQQLGLSPLGLLPWVGRVVIDAVNLDAATAVIAVNKCWIADRTRRHHNLLWHH